MRTIVAIVGAVLGACGAPAPRWEATSPAVDGASFRLVGTSMGNVPAVLGDGTGPRRAYEVVVRANDAALSAIAPGRPLFLDVEVRATIATLGREERAWLFLREEGSDGDPRQGQGEVGSTTRSCTDARDGCVRRFRVTIAFSGAAAGQEGIVSWKVAGKVAGAGAAQPPNGAAASVTIANALPEGKTMVALQDLAKGARATPGAAAPAGATSWLASGAIRDVQVRADGSILVREDDAVSLVDGAATKALARFEGGRGWSPDGDWVIGAASDRALRLWNVAAADAPAREIEVGAHEGFAVSSGGKWVAVTTGARTLRVVEVESGRAGTTLDAIDELASVRFADHRQTDTMVIPVVVLMTARSEQPWKVYSADGANLRDLLDARDAFLDDGWRVFREGSRLAIARAAEPALEAALHLGDLSVRAPVGGPVVDATGGNIALPIGAAPAGTPTAEVAVVALANGEVRVRWPGVTGPLAFSPDGRRLVATAGARIRILDVTTGAERTPP